MHVLIVKNNVLIVEPHKDDAINAGQIVCDFQPPFNRLQHHQDSLLLWVAVRAGGNGGKCNRS